MGKAVALGIKKKRAAQAALNEEILMHAEHGAVRALSLEVVTNLSNVKETRVRAMILNNGESALLALTDLELLTKRQWKAIKGKDGIEASVALDQHLSAEAMRLRFSDLGLLQPFKIDDSGDEFIKVGNTSAILAPIVRGTSLFVRLDRVDAQIGKVRFSKSQGVSLITL
jgi:hypothetical protein